MENRYKTDYEAIETYPITYDGIKNHVRVDAGYDEAVITSYIAQAIDAFERATECLIVQREVTTTYFYPPNDSIFRLPYGPIGSIISINGNEEIVEDEDYRLFTIGTQDYISITNKAFKNVIVYEGGYETLPPDIESAIWMDVLGRYEDRGPDGKSTNAFDKVIRYDRIVNRHRRGRGLL